LLYAILLLLRFKRGCEFDQCVLVYYKPL